MIGYFSKRVLMIIPTVLAVILVIFLLIHMLPGSSPNQISSYGGGDALDAAFSQIGLQDSIIAKYIRYSCNVFTLDLGNSTENGMAVRDEMGARILRTMMLTGLGLAAALVIGIPAGMSAAIHQGKWQDHAITFFTVLFSSIPAYGLALILCLFFTLQLKLLPAFGFSGPEYLILPTITLSVGGIASVARMTRSSMLDVLDRAYITALRAKGLRERAVISRHILKNILVPVISVLSGLVSQMICGALIVENFFSIPGLGFYLVSAIARRNIISVLGSSVFIAVMITVISVITDMLYALVSPSFKEQYVKAPSAGRKRVHGN